MTGRFVWRLAVVATVLWAPCLTSAAQAGGRVALVIGVSRYQAVASLDNPARDAASVARALRSVDFTVTELQNPAQLDRAGLTSALLAFGRAAAGAEAAVIYFAGHGVEVSGKNWLLPADVRAATPDELMVTAIPSAAMVNAVSRASRVRLVILDACRDNPFAREPGWASGRSTAAGRGLAREDSLPPNVVVLLATQPETKASDGQGTVNSPFARALSSALVADGMRLAYLPSAVSRQMRQASGVEQRPDQQGIFDEPDWAFRLTPIQPVVATQPARPVGNAVALPPVARPVSQSIPVGGGVSAERYARWGISLADIARNNDRMLFDKAGGAARLGALETAGQAGDPVALTLAGIAYDNGYVTRDLGKALSLYKAAANLGEARAMGELGLMYRTGRGTAQDYAEAMRWYRKGADAGNPRAMNGVGFMHRYGMGVTRDDAEAVRWYRRAADLGSDEAINNLGTMYRDALGVTRDYAQANALFRQSADLGNSVAMSNLAVQYRDALGVDQNYGEALRYFRLAADRGNASAMNSVGFAYQKGNGATQDYAEAMRWYRKAADLNNAAASYNIGYLYEYALGQTKDYAEASRWYRKSADLGDDDGMFNLAYLYANGLGVTADKAEALRWYRKAADQGNGSAMNNIANMYENGLGVTQDYAEAVTWYRKAMDRGNKSAINNLGLMYERGQGGLTQDYAEAIRLYRRAADLGNAAAMNNLAVLYHDGKGVAQDYAEARRWYDKAIAGGNAKARENLAKLGTKGL